MSNADRYRAPARHNAPPARASVPPARAKAAPAAPPPTWRDPWAIATALLGLPLLARCAGARLGEPVAEDFDFLRRTLFTGMGSLLDGGGSTAFWRPLAHQVYYTALGPLIVTHPLLVALLHALLLIAGSLLVFRALRPHLGGVVACAAASFPMLSESTRTLVSWPSQFVDVGLYCFTAVALHETARKRLALALGATLLALLCKELAVITALLLPWFPDDRPRVDRRRWALAFAVLLAAWGAAYLAVRSSARLALPHGLEADPRLLATPLIQRVGWAIAGSVRSIASLSLVPTEADGVATALAIGLIIALAARAWILPAVRARLTARRAWGVWGGAWFAAGTLALTPIFPYWQPNRAHFASAGLGVAAATALEAAHPALAGALVLGRGVLLCLAPPAAGTISEEPPNTGAFMDFARLTRLQRFMSDTRSALQASYPRAEPHAYVLEMNLPRGLMYALGGSRAVQVWYRDTTLAMVNYGRLHEDSTLTMMASVQFQPRDVPQVVLLSPPAMLAQDAAFRRIEQRQWPASLELLARADSLTPDPHDVVFHGNNAGYRAFALLQTDRIVEAEAEARRSLALVPTESNGLLVLGSALAMRGRYDEALAPVEYLLRIDPGHVTARQLRESILASRASAQAK